MLDFFQKNTSIILFFFLLLTGNLCFSDTLSAANTHEGILGQSLSSGQIVQVPQKTNQPDKKDSFHSLNRSTPKRSSGTASVRSNQFKIDSQNTITNSVDSRHGANIAIGDTDISNVQLNSAVIDIENTVYGRVKARGEDTRYRMGTVDIEGIHGGNLGISTENTVMGDVSVKNGQDVAIGVIEIGKAKKEQKGALKNDPSRNMPENNAVNYIKIGDYGSAVIIPWQDVIAENNDSSNEVCENEPVCFDSKGETGHCYNIDGCSLVANTLADAKFGEDGGSIFEDGRYIACNSHDQCYQTCETNQRACDIQFYYDLVDECYRSGANVDSEKVLTTNQLEDRGEAAKRGGKEILIDGAKAGAKAVVVTTVGTVGSGGVGFPAAAILGAKAGAKDFMVNFATGVITNPDYRYAGRIGIVAVPHLAEGISDISAAWLSDLNEKNKKDEWINEWEEKMDAGAKNTKTIVDKSAGKIKVSIYDIASSVESLGTGFNSMLDENAQKLAPKESFLDALPKNSANTCDVNKGFWGFIQVMGCELVSIPTNVYKGSETILSAASWGSKKAGSYLLESSGQVADYAGSILAEDIRFWGNQSAASMQYVGHKSIDLSNSFAKFIVNETDNFVEQYIDNAIFLTETTAKGIGQVRSLLYDCLSTAENYYIGVYVMGEFFFKGDNSSCIKNSSYNYHNLEQSSGQLTSYLDIQEIQSPLEKCRTQ